MAKSKTKNRKVYLCNECGGTQLQWMGKCPDCGAWDSLAPFTDRSGEDEAKRGVVEVWAGGPHDAVQAQGALPLPEVESAEAKRADPEKAAPRDAATDQILLTENRQHGCSLERASRSKPSQRRQSTTTATTAAR